MKKIVILMSFLLLSFIPVLSTNAQTTYQELTWTVVDIGGEYTPYAYSNFVDIDGWSDIAIYFDEDLADDLIFTASNNSDGNIWLNSRVNLGQGQGKEVFLNTIYDTEISGLASFKNQGEVEMNVVVGTSTLTAQQLQDELTNKQTFITQLDPSLSISTEIAFQNGQNAGFVEASQRYSQQASQAYDAGYSQGQIDSENETAAVATFIPQVMSLAFGFFFQIFSIEVMGISFLQWFAALAGIGISFVIFKAILK